MKGSTTPIKVGLFFGGPSREREISFASGRTVYDQLDRKYFEPIPVFVDSIGNFILLHWRYLYQGTIREFYPAITADFPFGDIPLYIESFTTKSSEYKEKIISAIGKKIIPDDFSKHFDMAFLCLYGPYGEDGSIQGLFQWYQMPYTGSTILPAALAIHKSFQHKILQNANFPVTRSLILSKEEWLNTTPKNDLLHHITTSIGLPFVVKSSKQGSSIGVTVVQNDNLIDTIAAIHKSFFIEEIHYTTWEGYTLEDKKNWLNRLVDIREGIGFPLLIKDQLFYTPNLLLDYITSHFRSQRDSLLLISAQGEEEVIIEAFIKGREFSCIVLEAAKGKAIALPPTEIIKENIHFTYTAKYLPGIVRKQTPMPTSFPILDAIRQKVIQLFQLLNCQVYARIDGFLTDDLEIILNDPNTTAGMNLSSFLFQQAAEIGLHPTQLLTFIIKRSLETRKAEGYLTASALLQRLEKLFE